MWNPIILMLLEVSILFSVKKTYHFHQKLPLSFDRNSVLVTTKQVDFRETDLLSGEPLSVICIALQQPRHKMVAVLKSVFFVKVPLQRYRIYFHISEKLLMTQNNLERDQNCKGKKSVTQRRKYLSWLLKFTLKFKKSVGKVISRFFPFGWELLITNACSGLAGGNYITNNYIYSPFVASDLLWLLNIFRS